MIDLRTRPAAQAGAGEEHRLLVILESLRSCSLAALRAVEADDSVLLLEILEQRQRLADQADPLLQRVRRPAFGAPAPRHREVMTTLLGIRSADARLAAAVTAQRDRAASLLDDMGRQAAEGAAYSTTSGGATPTRIDLTR